MSQSYSQKSKTAGMPVQSLLSGTPTQIIQSVVEQAFGIFRPKYIQLLLCEVATGRTFLWHAEEKGHWTPAMHSNELDQVSADSYLLSIPAGDWLLCRTGAQESLLIIEADSDAKAHRHNMPAAWSDFFNNYSTVMSAAIKMSDEWKGRLIVFDPSTRPHRAALDMLRTFCDNVARPIQTALLCLRACRASATEERARLARELHDGVIQSLLGVDLRLERLKSQTELSAETRGEISEVQSILRGEAKGLRQVVNDSLFGVLRPERLLEYLSNLLQCVQRDSGLTTHFFADLDNETMPARVCHEIARITEEAIINAKKHSKGSTLAVRVGSFADNWMLVIIDDGVGLGIQGAWSLEKLMSSGVGPRVIKDRVRSLGGDLLIESTSTGTRIEIGIPKNCTSRSELFFQKESVPLRA